MRFSHLNRHFVPRWVHKNIDGVQFEFLIGDASTADWYADVTSLSPEMRFMRDRVVSDGDIVLECGAHHGFMTVMMAHWIGETGRIVAFEASPHSASVLRQNIVRNGLDGRVCVEPKAVGRETGTMSFSNESNGVVLPGWQLNAVQVPVVSLDGYADSKPTLLKLDVEGYEVDVLRGATRMLETRPKIAIEVHVDMLPRYGHTADELFEYLPASQYELWLQLGWKDSPRPYAGERLSEQHIDQVHLYAIPRGGV
jgi:FkbM family methyltransferase